jgi:hypothetical protein
MDGNPSVEVGAHVNALIVAARRRERPEELRRMIRFLVPGYQPPAGTSNPEPAASDARPTEPRRRKSSHPVSVALAAQQASPPLAALHSNESL